MSLPIAPPVKPMLAKGKDEVPRGDEWIYEPKWDGFRAIVFRDGDLLQIDSRNARPLNRYFPEVEELLREALPDPCVVDGEIILPSDSGLDFDALQARLHPAASRVNKLATETPASFVVFDILGTDKNLCAEPLSERLRVLTDVFAKKRPKEPGLPATLPGPTFHLTPCTDDADVAQDWFVELEKVKCDGIVAKKLTLPYSPGERVMLKIKHKRTADCVVGGYRPHKHGGVGSLLLGLYDDGNLRYIGHTASFSAKERKDLVEILEPLHNESGAGFGEPEEWGPGAQSRWTGSKEYEWTSIEPTLVCEVTYDYVQSGSRFRHAAGFVRWRDDKKPEECTFDQLSD
jgi:ATP-dependent DNA ligase